MDRPTAWGLTQLAKRLTITSRQTSERTQWDPYPEQCQLWDLMSRYGKWIFAKPRKTGISLACEHADVINTHVADRAGNRMRTVFAIDTDDKAGEHVEQMADFCEQQKIRHRVQQSPGQYRIRFPNGSKIDCITAGGVNPARGGTIHRLHVTELPFWKRPRKNFQHMRSACSDNASIIIETTMDTSDPDGYAEKLWDDARHGRNEFRAHFWSVEAHRSYRSNAALTDEEWETCRKEGFTDKRAAAWWLKHALVNLCGGDMMRLMHDFPQIEPHLFAVGTGRVITRTPPPAVVVEHIEVPGVFGDTWHIQIYGEERVDPVTKRVRVMPIEHSGQVVISADTAMGRRKTNSVVFATDKASRQILGGIWSNTIRYDDLGSCISAMARHFRPSRDKLAEVVVEDDGVGDATCERLDVIGVPYHRFSQTGAGAADKNERRAANQERCITSTKRRAEGGMRHAPSLLRDEVKRFIKNEKGEYEGPKDGIMTYGIALTWISEHPYTPTLDPEARKDRAQRVYLEERLKEDRVRVGGGRPPWGT